MQNSRKVQMNNLKILLNNEELLADGRDWALLILRVIPSFYLFCLHGMDKITAGTETWVMTLFVLVGFKTRLASLFVMITMFLAGVYHLSEGENPESAFIYFTVYFTLFLRGPGQISIDAKIDK